MISITNYKLFLNLIFICLFISKFINVIQERIDIFMYIFWALPILIFYVFINKLVIKAYQWFCFLLIIYFLLSSLRVFGTSAYWLDILELFLISSLFISTMYGPRIINNIFDVITRNFTVR